MFHSQNSTLMSKTYTQAPLPFMGQKRRWNKEFKAALLSQPPSFFQDAMSPHSQNCKKTPSTTPCASLTTLPTATLTA